jgi:hypothetical protein
MKAVLRLMILRCYWISNLPFSANPRYLYVLTIGYPFIMSPILKLDPFTGKIPLFDLLTYILDYEVHFYTIVVAYIHYSSEPTTAISSA